MSLRGDRQVWTVGGALASSAALLAGAVCAQSADPACEQLETVLSQRDSGFSELQATPLQSPNQAVISTLLFLDSTDCKIRSSISSSEAGTYSCEWTMTGKAIAQRKFLALRDMVKSCRSDLVVNDEAVDPNEPVMLFITTSADTYIAIGLLSEGESSGSVRYRVGIDILSAQGFANWKALSGE
ncbi:MAG: hypothetical protein ACREEP_04680 [Dongiaceae bacterium]